MVREILIDWSTDGAANPVTVLYTNASSTIATERAAIDAFLEAADVVLASSTTWTIRTSGRELDTATGTLSGFWSDGTAQTGVGTGSANQAADATQCLVRWTTGAIVNGRHLQGRTFLPGISSTAEQDGNLATAVKPTVVAAALGLVSAGVGFSVWHRPINGSGGAVQVVTGAAVNDEFAVQRGRRG